MVQDKKRLMEIRKKMKKKRPKFRRVESWRYKRVKNSWRKARGIDSKTRRKSKSGVKSPNVGYRTPKKIRGLHPSGYEEVRVITKKDLEDLNPKTQAIKISGRLGAKKRLELIELANNMNIKILNIGAAQREMEEFEALLETPIEELGEEEYYEDDEYFDEEDLEDYYDDEETEE
ncbi:MAG: 50S ribosomal protein L32e [Candidatus Lokiarchaeota archaeon]|nr:50S ribosomal protein L32e [Candidatus Lokiarchaeota archaeon]MBD3338308.1 50S ribosomal protein L32e [Candidatus Lokiarchaeota archaeon]